MKSIRLNEGKFETIEIVDFQKDKRLLIIINLLSVVLFIVFYLLFFSIYFLIFDLKYFDILYFYNTFKSSSYIYAIVLILFLIVILIIHELIHGVFFYIYTGERPTIGFKGIYGYAGAPGWYIKKDQFYIISLSPLILITILGFIIIQIIPENYSTVLFLVITVNAAGSIGDIWISMKLLKKPKETYVNDTGLSITIKY